MNVKNRGFIQYSRDFNERLKLIKDKKKERIVLGTYDIGDNLAEKVAVVWEEAIGGRLSKVELLSPDWKEKMDYEDLLYKLSLPKTVAPTVQEFTKYLTELNFKDMTKDADESLPF